MVLNSIELIKLLKDFPKINRKFDALLMLNIRNQNYFSPIRRISVKTTPKIYFRRTNLPRFLHIHKLQNHHRDYQGRVENVHLGGGGGGGGGGRIDTLFDS